MALAQLRAKDQLVERFYPKNVLERRLFPEVDCRFHNQRSASQIRRAVPRRRHFEVSALLASCIEGCDIELTAARPASLAILLMTDGKKAKTTCFPRRHFSSSWQSPERLSVTFSASLLPPFSLSLLHPFSLSRSAVFRFHSLNKARVYVECPGNSCIFAGFYTSVKKSRNAALSGSSGSRQSRNGV